MFLPTDLAKTWREYLSPDHILKTSKGVYMVIEGTGRVYELDTKPSGDLLFQRQDSTRFFGFNYSACVFDYRDTIYSLGGYGLWQNNGQLRRFDPVKHGWEIVPTNRRVQARNLNLGFFVDHQNKALWYGNLFNKFEDLQQQDITAEMKEEGKLFQLDLTSKRWQTIGRLTDKFIDLQINFLAFGHSDQGTLIFGGLNRDVLLIRYATNQVLALDEGQMKQEIVSKLFGSEVAGEGRPISWYGSDSLHIYKTGSGHFSFNISADKFKDTGVKIYTPELGSFSWSIPEGWKILLFLTAGMTIGATGGYSLFRHNYLKREPEEPEYFNALEKRVLHAISTASGYSISVEEMDDLLGTGRKSKDMQNQKRSSVTRSINRTYQVITGDTENLIETRRQEFDRRMIRYELNQTKFASIRKQMSSD